MRIEMPNIIVEGDWKQMVRQVRYSLARQALLEALQLTQYNRRKAAQLLGCSRRQFMLLQNLTGVGKEHAD